MNWINIKDSLPEIGITVLGYWKDLGEDIYVLVRRRKDTSYCIFESIDPCLSMPEVTHWTFINTPTE